MKYRLENGDQIDETGNVPSEDCEEPASDFFAVLDELPGHESVVDGICCWVRSGV